MGYDPEKRDLEVEFRAKTGTPLVYRYADVPQATYDALMAADSKGAFLHNAIKGRFKHTKL